MSSEKFWILLWVVIGAIIICGIGVSFNYSNKQDKQFIEAGFTRQPHCTQWSYEWVRR